VDWAIETRRGALDSPARTDEGERALFRIGAVQQRWNPDAEAHREALSEGIEIAAQEGARLVCLQELTLLPYFAIAPDDPSPCEPEPLLDGPTFAFAAANAERCDVAVHASLYEAADDGGLGYNTAIVVSPGGELLVRTRKTHIPVTAGYHEDQYFRPGDSGQPVVEIEHGRFGFPTCWDQWFPELARAYSLRGAQVIVYPTAIGSEPDHPDFDTQPLWQHVIVANGITNGMFMVAVNRIGAESRGSTTVTFYGSSFVSDPYGRLLVSAPRDEPAVLVADLDLRQRDDWLALFPFLTTRRPETYEPLVQEQPNDARDQNKTDQDTDQNK
jgi:N-carbamoylputrescine amidase